MKKEDLDKMQNDGGHQNPVQKVALNKEKQDNLDQQPVAHIDEEQINIIKGQKKKNKEFNHAEYAKLVNKMIKDKKPEWKQKLDEQIKKGGKPLVQPNKQVMEQRDKQHKAEHKIKLKP